MQKQFQCRIKSMVLQFIPNIRKLLVNNLCGSTLASNFFNCLNLKVSTGHRYHQLVLSHHIYLIYVVIRIYCFELNITPYHANMENMVSS